jgi:hypothetical protein
MTVPNFEVNSHIHTPFSFCCFDSIDQAVGLAKKEDVRVLGINDFNTVEGYEEFAKACEREKIYPLFNMEFIALSKEDKDAQLRWNDPKNPGNIYFSGKALCYPSSFSKDARNHLGSIWKATQDQIWQVILKVNAYGGSSGIPLALDYNKIRAKYARFTVRERHVAKAIYDDMLAMAPDPAARLANYRTLFRDPTFAGETGNSVFMQNEIRNSLLKAGKPCFIEEKPEAFLPLKGVMQLILDGGGVPCYPILTDDSIGLNEYERDPQQLADTLIKWGIHAVEFIPLRNTFSHLKTWARHFDERGFCISFGTEHNTPEMYSLVPKARGAHPLDDELKEIGYRGACVLAAHQERQRIKCSGFVNEKGHRLVKPAEMNDFMRIGDQAIRARVEK